MSEFLQAINRELLPVSLPLFDSLLFSEGNAGYIWIGGACAVCIAYSGRCLLSGYMTHRDSNQGACTNSCRWEYQATPARETPEG